MGILKRLVLVLYPLIAVALGLLLVLIPLGIVGEIKTEEYFLTPKDFSEGILKLGGTERFGTPTYPITFIGVFALSFLAALVAYIVFKHAIK